MGLRYGQTERTDELARQCINMGRSSYAAGDVAGTVIGEMQLDSPFSLDRIEVWTDPATNAAGPATFDVQVETAAGVFTTIPSLRVTVPTTGRARARSVSTDDTTLGVADTSATSGGRVRLIAVTPPSGGTSAIFDTKVWVNYARAAWRTA
jgi:hypothetical protein